MNNMISEIQSVMENHWLKNLIKFQMLFSDILRRKKLWSQIS